MGHYPESVYLEHHGIKGQRWGIRRFQNKNGSLTPQGRRRYSEGDRRVGGIRRYQNSDGSLTEEGQKRYDRDIRENKAKKKDNRIDVSEPDPNRWAREDLERSRDVVDSSAKLVKQLGDMEQRNRNKPRNNQMEFDLSDMSDQELRTAINRKLLERQYNQLYSEQAPKKVSKGREYVQSTLEVAGTLLGVASSALGIALSIQKLRGK